VVDWGSRVAHWRAGVSLLDGPLEWAFGHGLGRLPATYGGAVREHGFPGSARIEHDGTNAHLALQGPARDPRQAGHFALTQRLGEWPAAARIAFDARVDTPTRLRLSVCEIHLLYEARCRRIDVVLAAQPGGWQAVRLPLPRGRATPDSALPRSITFAVGVLDVGARVAIDNLRLASDGRELLRNGDFAHGMARWFPSAQRYFVPWHIDSLPLELLIEQGLAGLAAFAALFMPLARRLRAPPSAGLPCRPVLVGSVAGALLIGLVSSVLDVPRVASLLYLFVFILLAADEPSTECRTDA
jgi:hypothetical protein